MLGNQVFKGSSPRKEKDYEMVNFDDERRKRQLSPLLQAAKDGNLKILNEIMDKGANIFEVDPSGASILHLAVYNDNFNKAVDCTEEILTRVVLNFNTEGLTRLIGFEDTLKQTALLWAASKGNDKVIRILLNRGSKLTVSEANETVFYVLAKLENHEQAICCAEVLLDAKYYDNDVEKVKNYLNLEEKSTNRTALHKAAISGNHVLIQLLISNGADAMKEDFVRCNVLHHAVGNAFEDKAYNCTRTLMQDHIIEDWSEHREKLLHSFHISGKCPIHIAARRGFNRILHLMSDYYLISEANTGFTALHSAASLGNQKHAEICVREILQSVEITQKLELLNSQDQDGCTAMYLAAKHKNVEACKLLLLEGSAFDINLSARDKKDDDISNMEELMEFNPAQKLQSNILGLEMPNP